MRENENRIPNRLSELDARRAQRLTGAEPPLDQVDWAALRTTINQRAALPLARRRSAPQHSAAMRWARPVLPLAAAASVALALWLGQLPGVEPGRGVDAAARAAFPTAEEALVSDVSEQEFQLLVTGRSNPEALLQIAIDDG